MKKINNYVNTMYKPSFNFLVTGLTVIALTLMFVAVSLRNDILSGEIGAIDRYPRLLEELYIRAVPYFLIVLGIDLLERKKKN